MLDPNVQKKGGFGAFAAREQEGNDVRAAEQTPADHAAAAAGVPSLVDTKAAPPPPEAKK